MSDTRDESRWWALAQWAETEAEPWMWRAVLRGDAASRDGHETLARARAKEG